MEMNEILQVCLVALCAGGFGVMLYFKVKGNVLAAISELIALAEMTDLPGAEKMAQVVAQLSGLVPGPLKTYFTAERLQNMAQWVFDWMRKYADEYRSKIKETENQEQADQLGATIGKEAATELIVELLSMTLAALEEKAAEYEINTEGLVSKKDFVTAIVTAILNKA